MSKFMQGFIKKRNILASLVIAAFGVGIIGFVTQQASAATHSMWGADDKPAILQDPDTASVELGVKFKSSVDGEITGIKFFKSAANTGTHTGSLWASNGTKLASVTFTNETESGWQTATFDQPVPITADTVYVASYHAPNGRYSVTENSFASDIKNGPLTMLASTSASKNGVYRYSKNVVFPNQSYKDSNYWVDVVFDDGINPIDASVASFSASPKSIISGASTTLAWDVTAGQSCSINNSIGEVANQGTQVVSPSENTTYTLTCQGIDGGADASAQATVEVTTPLITSSLWTHTDTPSVQSTSDDTSAVELGTKFSSSRDGTVKAIKFYKGLNNTGTHTGNLWASDGTNLASVTFTDETESGWQTAELATPVEITADTTYVVSYHAPNGRYAINTNYFNVPRTSGVLTAPQSSADTGNGVFRYGDGGFPDGSWNASNYWVDVVVETAASDEEAQTPPAVGFVPWEGGPAYWSSFQKASAAGWTNPDFFPISVFYGKADPNHVAALKDAGVNTYMAVEHHPDIFPLTNLTNQGMYAMPGGEWTPEEVGDNPSAVAWLVSDECEMGYSGCTGEDLNNDGIQDQYDSLLKQQQYVNTFRSYDDGRFLHANFGNGILRTYWGGDTMNDHVALMDSASADKYTYTSPHVGEIIDGVHDAPDWPNGVPVARAYSYGWQADQMKRFQDPANPKPIWTFIETAQPYLDEPGAREIAPDEIEGAVWSALIHEARGIAYFQHNNGKVNCTANYSIVECPHVHAKVKEINAKVKSLAAVLNSQSYYNKQETINGMTFYRYSFNNGTDTMLKKHNGSAYVFAGLGMGHSTGTKAFTLPVDITGSTVEVVGENRTIPVINGSFTDEFANEYTHHVYKIAL